MKLIFSQRRKRYEQMVDDMIELAKLFLFCAMIGAVAALLWHNYNL